MSMKRILLASLLVAIVLLPIGKAQALSLPKLLLSDNTLSVSSFESHFSALAKQASDPDQPDPEKVVYLTFDDGPDPHWTPQILEILARYHAGARESDPDARRRPRTSKYATWITTDPA
jgi:hypothetical protein